MNKLNFNWKIMAMVMIPVAIIMLIFDNDQNSKANMEDKVYKILTHDEWKVSKEKGFILTDLDTKDGFIHLSTAKQLAGTLFYYFEDYETLILVQFNSNELGKELVFEDPIPKGNRNGKFPHFYSKLDVDKISNYWEIKRGSFNLPEEVILDQEN
tara:strand:- start:2855 stop:3319 length:465 start_codon:yes stop_codon:yes gene_type:complete